MIPTTRRRGPGAAHGFTMLEIVIVLAVIGALSAALSPLFISYVSDAQRTRAQQDANQIAQAIQKFFEHVARPPYKNNTSTVKVAAREAGDFDCLVGSSGQDFTTVTDVTAGDSWTSAAGVQCQAGSATRDTIDNHLVRNVPAGNSAKAYATSTRTAWRGPYLSDVPSDPWGNRYLVNVGRADPGQGQAVWVISAGPNGQLETPSNASASGLVTAVGDDIIARVQ